MKIQWVKDLKDPQEKERFERDLRSSHILRKLKEIVEQEIASLDNSILSRSNYGVENWAYLQADAIGDRRRLKWLQEMITFDKETP